MLNSKIVSENTNMEEWVNNCVHHLSEECPFCGKQSYNFSHLRDHQYAQSGVASDSCPHCQKEFRRFTMQKQFMFVKPKHYKSSTQNTHGLVDKGSEVNAPPNQPEIQPNHERYLYSHLREFGYSCHYCRQVCRSFVKLRQHVLIHTQLRPHVCPYCNKACRWSEAKEIRLGFLPAETIHACRHCNEKHCQPMAALNQIDVHNRVCGQCNKGVNTNEHLHDHIYMKRGYQLKAPLAGKGPYQPIGLSCTDKDYQLKGSHNCKADMNVGPEISAPIQKPSTVSLENRQSVGVPPLILNGDGSESAQFTTSTTQRTPVTNKGRRKLRSPHLLKVRLPSKRVKSKTKC